MQAASTCPLNIRNWLAVVESISPTKERTALDSTQSPLASKVDLAFDVVVIWPIVTLWPINWNSTACNVVDGDAGSSKRVCNFVHKTRVAGFSRSGLLDGPNGSRAPSQSANPWLLRNQTVATSVGGNSFDNCFLRDQDLPTPDRLTIGNQTIELTAVDSFIIDAHGYPI